MQQQLQPHWATLELAHDVGQSTQSDNRYRGHRDLVHSMTLAAIAPRAVVVVPTVDPFDPVAVAWHLEQDLRFLAAFVVAAVATAVACDAVYGNYCDADYRHRDHDRHHVHDCVHPYRM